MKKILITTTIQDTIEGFLIPHIKFLEKSGYQVELACNMEKYLEIKELEKNIWHHINFSRNPFSKNSFIAIRELKKLMQENKYDMIHVHTPVAAFLGRLAGRLVGQKNVIYTAHGFHFYKGAPIQNWLIYYTLERLAAKWTDKLITINEEDYQNSLKFKLRKNGSCYKVNGVGLELEKYSKGNREKVRKELELSEEDFIITIIGELNKNKNQIQLIKAVELLEDRFKVLIAGLGSKETELKDYVKSKNLENRILFLGYRKDINDIVAASDILASMSYREGLPRNIMEGLAQGKSFVVTNIRGNRDIIKNGVNGYLIDVDDYGKTSEVIKKLEEEENYRRIENNNLEYAEKYSIKKILQNMEGIYNEGSISKS